MSGLYGASAGRKHLRPHACTRAHTTVYIYESIFAYENRIYVCMGVGVCVWNPPPFSSRRNLFHNYEADNSYSEKVVLIKMCAVSDE